MAYLGQHQTYYPRPFGFNSNQGFGQWEKGLANLTNLPNLLSRKLGKTQLLLSHHGSNPTPSVASMASEAYIPGNTVLLEF